MIVFAKLVDCYSIYQDHLELETFATLAGVPVSEVVIPLDLGDIALKLEKERILASGTFVEFSRYGFSSVWKAFSNWQYYQNNVSLLGYMLLGLHMDRLGAISDVEVRDHIAKNLCRGCWGSAWPRPWGFGLYNVLMPIEVLAIVLLVYPLQLIASRLWINRFRFGPCEWLWRTMTYGKLPPMRLPHITIP